MGGKRDNKDKTKGFLGRWLSDIAASPQSLAWSWLTMLACCFGRAFWEGALEAQRQLGFGLEPTQSLTMVLCHLPAFFIFLFLSIIILVHLITGETVDRITRLVAWGSPIIMLPVAVDAIFAQGGYQLYYLSHLGDIPQFLLYTFIPWKELPGASPGIRIEVALGCLAAAAYGYHRTGSILRAILCFAAVFFCCLLAGSLPLLLASAWNFFTGNKLPLSEIFGPGGLVATDTSKYALVFFLLAVVWGGVWLKLARPKTFAALAMASRPLRSIHYAGMVGLGFLAGYLTIGASFPRAFQNPFDYLYLAAAAVSLVFAFQSAVLLNDYFDKEIDDINGKPNPWTQNRMEGQDLIVWSAIYALVSIGLSFCLGLPQFLITVFCLVISILYSAPPLRLRRYYPLSVILVALASLSSSWLGYAAFGSAKTLELYPGRLAWFILICFGLSFATKDLNDVAGDRAAKLVTLPTVFGEKTGRRITAVLVVLAYALGPWILGLPWLAVVSIPAGLATAWLVLRPKVREGWVFAIYFFYGLILAVSLWHNPQALAADRRHHHRGQALSGLEYYFRREYRKAADLLESGAADDRQFLWPLARSHFQLKNWAGAESVARKILDQDPLSLKANYLMGRIYLGRGDTDLAQEHYIRAIDKGLVSFHEYLGDLYHLRGLYSLAEQEYRSPRLLSSDVNLICKLARAQLSGQDTTSALRSLDQALRLKPRSGRAQVILGEIFLAKGELDQARKNFEAATQALPQSPETWERLGTVDMESGDFIRAEENYIKALALDPFYGPAWSGLARVYLMTGRPEMAQMAMEKFTGETEETDISEP